MHTLIAKLGATGDVVRTTALLRALQGKVTWITTQKNSVFVRGLSPNVRCLSWEERTQAAESNYDLVINLEDTPDVAEFLATLNVARTFGAFLAPDKTLKYSDDSRKWFDLSLISVFGRQQADQLKYKNRSTYQQLIFDGLGLEFNGQEYLLPKATKTNLAGDIAIAAESGPVWPMKKWAYYAELKARLESEGFGVNLLPQRATLLEHLGDVQGHKCLVGGDTLPMHLALGSRIKCVSIFNCTSPWEIYEYGLQTKLISPLLGEFFYKRAFDERATTAISLDEVFNAVLSCFAPANV